MIGSVRLSDLQRMCGGRLTRADVAFSAVSTDTRTLEARDLYVALSGKNFDGNRFVSAAREKGACAAVVSCAVDDELPQLVVPDTRQALGMLGRANRRKSSARMLAITGSQGKTTVKEMTGKILQGKSSTLQTSGNLNNDIGVPLTLLELDASHKYAVIELGASAAGEIAYTVALTEPDLVLINNAAAAHLEGFGSLEGIVQAKGEIIDGVAANGVVVLNADDRNFPVWQERAGGRKVVAFGLAQTFSQADYTAEQIQARADGSGFLLKTPQGEAPVNIYLPGRHNVANALAAAAISMEAGATLQEIEKGLATVQPVSGRLYALAGVNNSRLIDDSYNASPSSFFAAIDVLAGFKDAETVLIMGDMAELGEDAGRSHREVGQYAASRGIGQLWCVGVLSAEAAEAFGGQARHFNSQQQLLQHARESLQAGMVALVKGSRSAGMDTIVDALQSGEPT